MTEENKPDDESLFRQEMQDVEPLAPDDRHRASKAGTPATPGQAERRRAAAAEAEQLTAGLSDQVRHWVEPEATIAWRQDGIQHGVFRELGRGKYGTQDKLDLHRHTVTDARLALARFIRDSHERGLRNVLVVHGRGRHSQPHPALLKSLVAQWLPELQPVLAFHTAQPPDGGAGAVYVMLKKHSAVKMVNRELNRKR